MPRFPAILCLAYWLLTFALFAVGLYLVASYVPTESTMGQIQKIFYLHLPIAINAFLVCLLVFICGIGYLWQRNPAWDLLALAAAKIAVLYCSIVLLTGVLWGKNAWGQWWTWSPRLTFSLILWLLYLVYLTIRSSIDSPPRRALIAAVYGIVAFLDVPLVYLSVRLMPDIHPTSIALEPPMKFTLTFWFLPVTLLTLGLLYTDYHLQKHLAPPSTSP